MKSLNCRFNWREKGKNKWWVGRRERGGEGEDGRVGGRWRGGGRDQDS